jgi:hypothetical protein
LKDVKAARCHVGNVDLMISVKKARQGCIIAQLALIQAQQWTANEVA